MTITDIAAEKAKAFLAAEGKADWGIRVFIAGSSCCGPSYGMDIEEKPGTDDEIIEYGELKLFVNKSSIEQLRGIEIDFVDDGERQGFIIRGNEPPSSCSSC